MSWSESVIFYLKIVHILLSAYENSMKKRVYRFD